VERKLRDPTLLGRQRPALGAGSAAERSLALVVRDRGSAETRHLLDVIEMITDVSTIAEAARCAREGSLLRRAERDVMVFDLRAGARAEGTEPPAAEGPCLLITERDGVRMALIVN
jgi:hypothetical protein